jgi:hypothetical protein
MTTVPERITAYLEDTVFGIGWVRALVDMYSSTGIFHHPKEDGEPFETSVYVAVTDVGGGFHGNDIVLGFYQPNSSFGSLVEKAYPKAPALAKQWQAYLAGFVLSGDPNTIKSPGTPRWRQAVANLPPFDFMTSVMFIQDHGMGLKLNTQARLQVLLDSMFILTMTYLPSMAATNPSWWSFADAACVDKEYGFYGADKNKLPPELLGRSTINVWPSFLRGSQWIA